MENFGLLNRINGMEELPFWKGSCNSIRASEGNLIVHKILGFCKLYVWLLILDVKCRFIS